MGAPFLTGTFWNKLGVAVAAFLALGVAVHAQVGGNVSVSRDANGKPTEQAPAEPGAVIRTTTRLVQVSVVVTDKKGLPIPNLKKEDFTILDEKAPQQIVVFEGAAAGAKATQPVKLPPNIFTNRLDVLGKDPGSTNIVLLDLLNTFPSDALNARNQVLRFLRALKPQDRVAIYALTDNLLILHEFTEDSAALVDVVNHAQIPEVINDVAAEQAFNALSGANAAFAQLSLMTASRSDAFWAFQQNANRVETTCAAMRIIADHVSGLSGRKSLIWISGGFPMDIFDPTGDHQNFTEAIRSAADALSRADIVAYPVDARGVEIDPGVSSVRARNAPTAAASLNSPFLARRNRIETFNVTADETGGRAFYGTNDLSAAAKKAVEDGKEAYTLGFYPDHGKWDGRYRKVKIVVNVPGAELRYRKGYVASEAKAGAASIPEAEIAKAALSPFDSTALRLVVSVRHTKPEEPRQLDFQAGADVAQLLLMHVDGKWKGDVDLLFMQRDAKGELLKAEQKRIGMDFPDAQYEGLLKSGAIFEKHLEIAPKTADVRVLVRDVGSGVTGTVTVPIAAFVEKK